MSLLQLLRDHTRDIHSRLDTSVRVGEATGSLKGYADYLDTFYRGLLASMERIDWSRAENLGLPHAERRRGRYDSLTEDLRKLGEEVPPLPAQPAAGTSDAATAGCLYVLEGSVHGGRQLLKMLEANAGPVAHDASRFFRAFGEETPEMWRHFTGWLDNLPNDGGFESEAVDAAVWCFRQFVSAFEIRASSISESGTY